MRLTGVGFREGFTQLLTTLRGIQAGKLEDKHGWRQEVQEPKIGEGAGAEDANAVGAL